MISTTVQELPTARVERAEWQFVAITTLVVLVVTTVPYLYGYLATPPGKQYMGIMFDVADHAQYFSWMRELSTANLASNKLTPEPNAPAFFNLLWWLMGHIGRLFHLDYAAMFQILRVVVTATFLPTVYWLGAWFFEDRLARQVALLVAILSSGFGWLIVVAKYLFHLTSLPLWLNLLIYIIEPNTFFGILSTPHLVGAALYIAVFGLVLWGEASGQLRYAVAAGLFAAFIGWQHTYDLILVYSILGVYWLLKWLRDRRPPIYLLYSGLIVGALSCPAAVYSLMLTSLDPLWRDVLAQYDNAGVLTPNPLLLPVLLGPAFLLALFTTIRGNPFALKRMGDTQLFLTCWFWANLFLLYIPTNYQIKMLNGFQVPIALLATQGLYQYVQPAILAVGSRLRSLWPGTVQRGLAWGLMLAVIPTNVYLLAWRFVDLRRHSYPYYLGSDEIAAFQWLESNAAPDDVVLSSVTTGQYIPAFTGAHAYLAHWAQTVRYYEKRDNVAKFFDANADDETRKMILDQHSVDYVFYGPAEQALGSYTPNNSAFSTLVFSTLKVKIYAINP